MTNNLFSVETPGEREMWAKRVKTLRQRTTLTQTELAHEAGTSRQTINNIERGALVPQAATLKKVLSALGVNVNPVRFEQRTEGWLTVMGKLIETIPEVRREKHVTIAMDDLVDGIAEPQEYENSPIAFPDVSGGLEDEAHSLRAVASDMEGGPEHEDQ